MKEYLKINGCSISAYNLSYLISEGILAIFVRSILIDWIYLDLCSIINISNAH